MVIVLLSSAFRLGCFPISCSAFRASRICFFCSAFYISGFFRGAFCICVLCFNCGTFFYSAFSSSAFFSCSCFDYCFRQRFLFLPASLSWEYSGGKLQKQSQERLLQVRNSCRCEGSFSVSFPFPDVLCGALFPVYSGLLFVGSF